MLYSRWNIKRITFSIGLGNRENLGNLHEELWDMNLLPRLAKTFGGFTLTKGRGGWISPSGQMFIENQMDISVLDLTGLGAEIIRDTAEYLAEYFGQEAVMVTVQAVEEVRFIEPRKSARTTGGC